MSVCVKVWERVCVCRESSLDEYGRQASFGTPRGTEGGKAAPSVRNEIQPAKWGRGTPAPKGQTGASLTPQQPGLGLGVAPRESEAVSCPQTIRPP